MAHIPPSELARRICDRTHPYLGSTGAAAPCGTHLAIARNMYGLLVEDGDIVLAEVLRARHEVGLANPWEPASEVEISEEEKPE
jgi:hypothetical protein